MDNQHQELFRTINLLVDADGIEVLPKKLLAFLTEWWLNNVEVCDQLYRRHAAGLPV
ncbi:MAG: hypothetical protein WC865_12470 [Bacteroidales bacterium]